MKKKERNRQKMEKSTKKKRASRFNDFRIGLKYTTTYLIMILIFLIAGAIVFLQLNQAGEYTRSVQSTSLHMNDMAELAYAVQGKDVQIADYLLTQDPAFIDSFREYEHQFESLIESIEPNLQTNREKNLLEALVRNDEIINNTFTERIIPSVESNQVAIARGLRETTYRYRVENMEIIEELASISAAQQHEAVEASATNMNESKWVLAVANLSAMIVGIVLIYLISRRISRELNRVVQLITEVAHGNLRVKDSDYVGKDEIGQLSFAINLLKRNMKNILTKITDASNNLSSQSEELNQAANEVKEGNLQIAATMEELSSGAENQANSASNLTESMTDFIELVNISNENGNEVQASSKDVLNITNEGKQLMTTSVSQMKQIDGIVYEAVDKVKELDKKSEKISNLVNVIEDIANQTNLLSLNAAIEAARAGEHGHGFAVVADEVRKLSEQVSASVGEITTIVTAIQAETGQVVDSLSSGYEEVREGTEQIEMTGKQFEAIQDAVRTMTEKLTTISNNLNEVADNSDEMNHLIEEIASISEESAAGVEQAAASSQQTASSMEEVSTNADELARLAEQLNEEIGVFKL